LASVGELSPAIFIKSVLFKFFSMSNFQRGLYCKGIGIFYKKSFKYEHREHRIYISDS
jgi:hypothetical protein